MQAFRSSAIEIGAHMTPETAELLRLACRNEAERLRNRAYCVKVEALKHRALNEALALDAFARSLASAIDHPTFANPV